MHTRISKNGGHENGSRIYSGGRITAFALLPFTFASSAYHFRKERFTGYSMTHLAKY